MRYRAEIDGLRTVAVLPVIVFHAGYTALAGGFVGVDIFFVISGFLITSILVNDLKHGRFSIVDFYERRARRILPALFLVTACSIVPAILWLLPRDLIDFGQSIAAIATFSSNILFYTEADYFDAASELKPMLHTWSLAVEEQYYIVFPPLLALLWTIGPRVIIPTLAAGLVASFALAVWLIGRDPSAAFYLLPTRAWSLRWAG